VLANRKVTKDATCYINTKNGLDHISAKKFDTLIKKNGVFLRF